MTADTAVGGTIDNLTGGRVTTQDGYGSFAVTYQNGGHDLVLSGFEAVPLTYPLWITGSAFTAGEGAFAADPDRDGMTNGLEYGLGSDPLVPDLEAVPRVSVREAVAGSGIWFLTLTYERPAGVNRPADLVWNVQRNPDLSNASGWSTAGLSAEELTPSPGTGLETVMVRSQTAVGAAGPRTEFLRLTVTKP